MRPIEKSLFDYQKKLSNAMEQVLEMVNLTYDGFIKHKKSFLSEAEKIGKTIHQFEKDFTSDIVKEGNKDSVRLLISLRLWNSKTSLLHNAKNVNLSSRAGHTCSNISFVRRDVPLNEHHIRVRSNMTLIFLSEFKIRFLRCLSA